ncbi:MAG: J domain-containing protein [Candidatus Aminicenantes bacterium]|nr:MAG: J domain-containing protein [Candidatus Aminicenantes bacterium]
MDNMKRYYQILELEPGASPEEVKQAYRDLAKVWHPDRFSHDPSLQKKAQEKLKEINEAYEKLSSHRPDSHYRTSQQESWSQKSQSWSQSGSYQYDKSWTYQKPSATDDYERSRIPRVITLIIVGIAIVMLSKIINVPGSKEKTRPRAKIPPVERFLRERHTQPSKVKDKSSPPIPEYMLPKKKETPKVESPPSEAKPVEQKRVTPLISKLSEKKKAASPAIPAGYFSLGSTKKEVLAAQGNPDQALTKQFRYGTSYIYFSKGKVTGWNIESHPLKVMLKPAKPTSKTVYDIGSTMDEVLTIQGTPDYYSEGLFRYGTSYVYFSDGRVTGWKKGIPELKLKKSE